MTARRKPPMAWFAEGIEPRREQLARIWSRGRIAVLFHEVDPRRNAKWLECLGWSGARVQLRPITKQAVTRVVDAIDCTHDADKPIARWLRQKDVRRVLVFTGHRFFCLTVNSEGALASETTITSSEIFA